jgi:phage terminase large subunit GpA-like protein
MTIDQLIDRVMVYAQPKDRRPIREWASDHVTLSPPLTVTGKFTTFNSRYLEAPLDALDNERVRQVNIRAPVRGGKTLIADVWLPHIVAREPGPTMWVTQKDDMSTEHSEARLLPVLKKCEQAAKHFPLDARKVTPTDIMFTNDMQLYVRGPSLSNLQAKGIRYMILDEAWDFKAGVIDEAKGRLGDYEKLQNSKLLILSQGGFEESDWDKEFESGVIHEWRVRCCGCKQVMPLVWDCKRKDAARAGMRWDEFKDENGLWDIEKCKATVRYECPLCGHPHFYNARTMAEWNRTGDYVVTNAGKNPAVHSYEWNAIITRSWDALVDQFLGASNSAKRGVWLPMVVFWQKRMAKNKSESSFLLSRAAEIRMAEYKPSEEWPDEQYRAITVDCQKDLEEFWVKARAWGKLEESRSLGWWHILGQEKPEEGLTAKDDALAQIEKIRLQLNVEPQALFMDVAYSLKEVLKICGKMGYTGLWGADVAMFTHTTSKVSFQRIYGEQNPKMPDPNGGVYFRWAKPTVADYFDQLKRGKAGKWTASVNAGQTYSDHLNAQYKRCIIKPKTGMKEWVWVLRKHGMDDHLLDCERMQVVAASMAGVLDDTIFAAPEQPEKEREAA